MYRRLQEKIDEFENKIRALQQKNELKKLTESEHRAIDVNFKKLIEIITSNLDVTNKQQQRETLVLKLTEYSIGRASNLENLPIDYNELEMIITDLNNAQKEMSKLKKLSQTVHDTKQHELHEKKCASIFNYFHDDMLTDIYTYSKRAPKNNNGATDKIIKKCKKMIAIVKPITYDNKGNPHTANDRYLVKCLYDALFALKNIYKKNKDYKRELKTIKKILKIPLLEIITQEQARKYKQLEVVEYLQTTNYTKQELNTLRERKNLLKELLAKKNKNNKKRRRDENPDEESLSKKQKIITQTIQNN